MTDSARTLHTSCQQQGSTRSPPVSSCEMCCHWETQTKLQAITLSQLQNRLVDRDLSLARLQQDMHQLNSKYVAEIERAADLQHQKDLVEHDLEDLSCKLFEEANGMVAVEKRENWRLETKLQTMEQQLGDEQAQLAELRQKLLQWDQNEQPHYWNQQNRLSKQQSSRIYASNIPQNIVYPATHLDQCVPELSSDSITTDTVPVINSIEDTCHYINNCTEDDEWTDDNKFDRNIWKKNDSDQEKVDNQQIHAYHDINYLHRDQHTATITSFSKGIPNSSMQSDDKAKKQQQQDRFVPISPIPSSTRQRPIKPPILNQVHWKTFQHFAHNASTVPLKKLHQFTYLQICQIEDVEPCLRFGPRSRLSAKKMMEHLLQESCFIQHLPMVPQETTSTIPSSITAQWPFVWDKWQASKTNPTSVSECVACGQSDSATIYQFRMDEKDNWMPMDKFCRDRLVAVCEFFVFIRNIHLCLYTNQTMEDLYWENIRLRLQMFHTR